MREEDTEAEIAMGLKEWLVKWYIKRQLKRLREGKSMDVGSIIGWVLKLKFLSGYRTKIGAVGVLVGTLLPAILGPDMVAAFPALADAPEWMIKIGAYAGIIGARYKDDA